MISLVSLFILCVFVTVQSATDTKDVQALWVLYSSLNSPSQLSGWSSNGSDPCGNSWKGIACSGSAVTSIIIPGLGINGTLGYTLSDLLSLKTLDLSNNKIHETIPYQLPPNLTSLNLADNNLTGTIPYSISSMHSLVYLNLSHNYLTQTIEDIFTNLQDLSDLDLSFNILNGDLPISIGSLSNLSRLFLQNNQLTGQVRVLASLELSSLNIANNHFNGWIPQEFKAIPNLQVGGNSFANGPAPPPPPYVPPPPRRPHHRNNPPSEAPDNSGTLVPDQEESSGRKKRLNGVQIIGIVIGSLLGLLSLVLAIVFCLRIVRKRKDDTKNGSRSNTPPPSIVSDKAADKETGEQCTRTTSMAAPKPPPSDSMLIEKVHETNGSVKKSKLPINVTSYTVAFLQTATNSFSQDSLVGEGSLGRVYKAEFSNGKVYAVKKIDTAVLALQDDDNFLEAVSNMSHLRHPNITTLVGYCVEHGQRLLVYEYIGHGTLHDILHYAEDTSVLTWNARVRVALGTARALEYLHEVCLPSLVHRNFKSANILLDEDLNPHLSDCGLAALVTNKERQLSTEMVGSFGYSAPEFAMSGIYTVKSDVYSFGIVMLELLTGRKPLDGSRVRSEQSLVSWAAPQLHDIDSLSRMVDPALNGMYPAKSLSRFADIIALCIQPEPEFRPPISEVVQSLIRLMQRASAIRRQSGEELGISYRISEHDPPTDYSF